MFREMRRAKQRLSLKEAESLLQKGTSGVLALHGDGGYPYAVPLSYVYSEGKIFFHCALAGHKMDAISRNEKASFCVVAQDLVLPEKYTTAYKSIIAFGRAHILEGENTKRRIALLLAEKYNPGRESQSEKEAANGIAHMNIIEFTIEHLTGKQSRELI